MITGAKMNILRNNKNQPSSPGFDPGNTREEVLGKLLAIDNAVNDAFNNTFIPALKALLANLSNMAIESRDVETVNDIISILSSRLEHYRLVERRLTALKVADSKVINSIRAISGIPYGFLTSINMNLKEISITMHKYAEYKKFDFTGPDTIRIHHNLKSALKESDSLGQNIVELDKYLSITYFSK
jgi:hypothetical protein